jgi:long-subunit fatty acid transport protein
MKKTITLFYKFLLLPCLIVMYDISSSVAQEQDFRVWGGVSISKNFTNRISLRLRQEARMKENATQFQKVFFDAGLRYKMNKHFRFAFHYRLNQHLRRDYTFSSRHRFNADLIYRRKFNTVVINYRLRLQSHFRDVYTSENGRFPDYFMRHKLQAHVNLNSRFSPFASTEMFHTFTEDVNKIVQWRYRLGMAYEINKMHNISMFYMIQEKQNINVPQTNYILGLRLNLYI